MTLTDQRYNAGFIADHPLLQEAEYYWKVQPRSRYLCDIKEDPFVMMKSQGKKLGKCVWRKTALIHVIG